MDVVEFIWLLEEACRLGLKVHVREELLFISKGISFFGGFTDWAEARYFGSALHWANRAEKLGQGLVIHFDKVSGYGDISALDYSMHLEIRIEIPDLM